MFNKKRLQMLFTSILAIAIIVTGTFAWSSFNQNRINTFIITVAPGVNLHDDFDGGPNKDVYVENSGQVDVYVRVRLTEFFHAEQKDTLIAGHSYDESSAKLGWFPHNGTGGADSCEIAEPYQRGELWDDDGFHDYFTWTMGGQKYYKTAVAQLGKDVALGDEPPVCEDLEEYYETNEENGILQTLWADVITMETWLMGGYTYSTGPDTTVTVAPGERAQGHFWVVDTDGWCYWASPLKEGQTTGLLLDNVERAEKNVGQNAQYSINVWLQAVDKVDLERITLAENGGITDGGQMLIQQISGKETKYFHHMGSGIYIEVANSSATEPLSGNVKYYFAGTILNDGAQNVTLSQSTDTDGGVAALVTQTFRMTFSIGQTFDIVTAKDGEGNTYIADIIPSEDGFGAYTMPVLIPVDGHVTIPLNDEGTYYIGEDANGVIGAVVSESVDNGGFSGEIVLPPSAQRLDGEGTQVDPFRIRNRGDMDLLSSWVAGGNTFSGKYLRVENDFSMGSTPFTPVGNHSDDFRGKFDGNNCTISGLVIKGSVQCQGLIGCVWGAFEIKDLTLKNVNISGTKNNVGGFVGDFQAGTITNCHVESGTITSVINNIGGIAGYSSKTIQNCSVSNVIVTSGSVNAGGIAGYSANSALIQNCTAENIDVTAGSHQSGGITGYNDVGASIRGCNVIGGSVKANGNNAGGIAGYNNSGNVIGCLNTADVMGDENVGGVVGYHSGAGALSKCANKGKVTGTTNVGGVVGCAKGSISDCYAWCDVSGEENVGGVTGYMGEYGIIIDKVYHAKGTVSGTSGVGGLAGYKDNGEWGQVTLMNSVALAESVSGSENVNRVIGYPFDDSFCYAWEGMNITPTGGDAGTGIPSCNPDESWWSDTVYFSNTNGWTWDQAAALPVLMESN